MALYADRVKDSTSITGTGAITLSGTAPTGFQSFATAFGASPQTVAYCIADQTGNNWEVGTGVFNGTTGLTRVTVLASSNGGSLTNFSGGTQDVFCTAPAKYLDTFTSANQGVVPASGGGTTNFLRADGTFAAPAATAPASPTTSVQFNNAGVFGGSANFTYDTGTNTFTVGPAGATTNIETLAPTGATIAGTLRFRGKNASATNGAGGGFSFLGGTGTGTNAGGSFGIGGGSGGATGGGFSFIGGGGTALGGGIQFDCGSGVGASGVGGGFTVNAGQGESDGGSFTMNAGSSTNAIGGGFILQSGFSINGNGGDFQFNALGGPLGNGVMYFNTDYGGTVIQLTATTAGASELGFYGVTPVAQPTTATTAATRAAVIGTVANIGDTYDGYTLAKVVKALRNLGILA